MNLLPDRIKAHWAQHEQGEITYEQFQALEKKELDRYQAFWAEALILPDHTDLYESLISEIVEYTGLTADETKVFCDHAVQDLASEWRKIPHKDPTMIEGFYNLKLYIYELMAWHSLKDDNTPLAYVMALEFARKSGCKKHLDFGSGVGSGTILFQKYGVESWMCDISQRLLNFAHWRQCRRKSLSGSPIYAGVYDLWKHMANQFDFITAMEVIEHLYDPLATIDNLYKALKPEGYLFLQLNSCRPDPERPQHIVTDPQPIFERLSSLGMTKVWCDNWVWGHDCFQKGK
jgi:2-polyprenyl-3-methyl-5-hydroxy-6-metoxy-1,4-benzoquinol methylase